MIILETLIGTAVLLLGIAAYFGFCWVWMKSYNFLVRNNRNKGQADYGNTLLGWTCFIMVGGAVLVFGQAVGRAIIQ